MALVYLGLGSNLGDRLKNIQNAVALLSKKITVEKISKIIETDPVGGPPQGKYLNAVIKAQTDLSPRELLEAAQAIEKDMGRIRTVQDAPRIIDIDILLYGHERINEKDLIVPHPKMLKRAFVMKPLNEIDATLVRKLVKEYA